MNQYLDLLKKVRQEGREKGDRTGTGTISVFGYQMRYDLSQNFPLLTTKKVHFKSMAYELLWFLNGDNNIKYLNENGVRIWDEWADKDGNLGPVYGVQWRRWQGKNGDTHDQIKKLIKDLKENPHSRRHIISAWNVPHIDTMALPPCHTIFQFYVLNGKLSCQLYQRSADVFLGVPFNIASYALLTMMVAQVCNLKLGDFVHTFGDAHIYLNHLEQAKLQLTRMPKHPPILRLNGNQKVIEDFKFEDFEILNYNHHPHIPAPIAV